MLKCGMGMDPAEITKVIDGVYKNILENFNPASREMIATGKAYLKALHGASAASSLYLESLLKLSKQAEAESSLGCSTDIGSSLMEVTQVFKEIHTQQLSTLKAFYVDFLVPLETNLERDTRVVQNEQKKFAVSHKRRIEGFVKASANAKKMKKKGRKAATSSTAIDKEIKVMQELEEEKAKLELFSENSLNTALTEERRRYGFILERQASLAKHYLAYYAKGNTLLSDQLEEWMLVSKSREVLPPSMQTKLISRLQKGSEDDCVYCTPRVSERAEPNACATPNQQRLRKSKSMEGTEMLESVEEEQKIGTISRAKSDISLVMSNSGGGQLSHNSPTIFGGHSPSSSLVVGGGGRNALQQKSGMLAVTTDMGVVKAVYPYLSSGDNQLSFLEGDIIILVGERSNGWQFGENVRTQKSGWFPLAYTEGPTESPTPVGSPMIHATLEAPDPPPPPPPTGPTGLLLPYHPPPPADRTMTLSHQIVSASTQTPSKMNGRASDSPHSSNDSGFSNDIHKVVPPQPEVDYSEDEPQMSSSDTLKSGDAWLMEKYHQSESARIKRQSSAQPRRALSFVNVSESAQNREAGRSRPIERQPRASRHNSTSSQRSEGPIKKFLTRTKSFIWKKSQSPPTSRHGIVPSVRGPEFDSVSATGSCESDDPWGTHLSIVQLNAAHSSPPRRPPPSIPVKEAGRHGGVDGKSQQPIKAQHQPQPPIKIQQLPQPPIKIHQQSQTEEPREPPPLPPLPPPLPWRGPKMANNDTKENVLTRNEYASSSIVRKSKKTNATSHNGSIRRSESEKGRKYFPVQKMLRVESFSGSEPPIIPHRGALRFPSRASIQSQNLDEEDEFLDDARSSVFIENIEENENCFPPPPPPIKNIEKSKRTFEISKGSLRLLGGRVKSQSLRIVPNESNYAGSSIGDDGTLGRNSMRRRSGGRRVKGAIRSEVHTLELIASESETGSGRGSVAFQLPLFEYGRQIRKRLYYPERTSKLDQKSERTGNLCGPWYDLWGIDSSVTQYTQAK